MHVESPSTKYFLCTQKFKSNVWLVGGPKAFNTWCYLSKAQNISSSANLSYQKNVEDFIRVKCTSFLKIVKLKTRCFNEVTIVKCRVFHCQTLGSQKSQVCYFEGIGILINQAHVKNVTFWYSVIEIS